MNLIRALIIFQLLIAFGIYSKEVPTWLDTIPPTINVKPTTVYHNKPFSVTLSMSKEGKLFYGETPNKKEMIVYEKPIIVVSSGTKKFFFYGIDLFGNSTPVDSAKFVLDMKAPHISLSPQPGIYSEKIDVNIKTSEDCKVFVLSENRNDTLLTNRKFTVTDKFKGIVYAVDSSGNIAMTAPVEYMVDTSTIEIEIIPKSGVYNERKSINFKVSENAKVYYSFNPNLPTEYYTLFDKKIKMPAGLSSLSYYAKKQNGSMSKLSKVTYLVDTVPPRIRYRFRSGGADTLYLFTNEKTEIHYILRENTPFEESFLYKDSPIVMERKGKVFISAIAIDRAGNSSKRFLWERKYDKIPPKVKVFPPSGKYNKPISVHFKMNEPGDVFYTFDHSDPDISSAFFADSLIISREGKTLLKFRGFDESENYSNVDSVEYELDLHPPYVRAKIDGSAGDSVFTVHLKANERADIFYSKDNTSTLFKKYSAPLKLVGNEILFYYAIDDAGNKSRIAKMDNLTKPLVSIYPKSGIYGSYVNIKFKTNVSSVVYYRIAPDIRFVKFKDSLKLTKEGLTSIDYYSVSNTGLKTPVLNSTYKLDWTPPKVKISLRKGIGDSMSVFFTSSEKASIYYTTDGTSPFFSKTVQVAGNKFTTTEARISVVRNDDLRLAFYSEDIAGNQSNISIIDLFKPKAIPSVPSGVKHVYNKVLSVALNTYDERSQIYYERNNKDPDLNSPIYKTPITVIKSDTIKAFVVDASGYRGPVDTFVYNIDLPPSAYFELSSTVVKKGEGFTLDASGTFDQESPSQKLKFYWDFDGDGKSDVTKNGVEAFKYKFEKSGRHSIILEVEDPSGNISSYTKDVFIQGLCPDGMVFIPRKNGRSFCIDKYEWPNRKNSEPKSGLNWVQAYMNCHDVGKRLCTKDEWSYACSGAELNPKTFEPANYPYGSQYDSKKCSSSAENVSKSGKFKSCGGKFAVFDMVGNLWEWIADDNSGSYKIMGGSYNFGADAKCTKVSAGAINSGNNSVGTRCCK